MTESQVNITLGACNLYSDMEDVSNKLALIIVVLHLNYGLLFFKENLHIIHIWLTRFYQEIMFYSDFTVLIIY